MTIRLRLPNRPLIIAHRGASGCAPENTLLSFARAIELGADMAECDAHMTRDGHVVILHDETVDRTTDGQGEVWALTLAELKKMDAGAWFSTHSAGQTIPTLEELIALLRGRISLNIEIKRTENEPDLAERVDRVIRARNYTDQCVVTSFDVETLRRLRRLNPDLILGPVALTPDDDLLSAEWPLLSLNHRTVGAKSLGRMRWDGRAVHVWTVNHESRMRRLIELGVDGIMTNYPERLARAVPEKEKF